MIVARKCPISSDRQNVGLLTIPRRRFPRGSIPRCSVPRRTFQRRCRRARSRDQTKMSGICERKSVGTGNVRPSVSRERFSRTLRSATQQKLIVPRYRLNGFGRRRFAVAGPSTWNSLPDSLRDPELSLNTFKRQLKTYIFTRY